PAEKDDSFSIQMEELHQNFLTNLNARYPELTTYDLRLCAYLKSGLSTREIADLLNVLPSSVNVSRSRLRKKLQLGSKDDLYKFLNTI
ncbi:MAG: LuxR C-terminal-related transcriptional regulator, partial [Bacteroidota bacterium]